MFVFVCWINWSRLSCSNPSIRCIHSRSRYFDNDIFVSSIYYLPAFLHFCPLIKNNIETIMNGFQHTRNPSTTGGGGAVGDDSADFISEATEAAVTRIAELLRHPDDLTNKFANIKKKIATEKGAVDAQLKV